MRTGYGNRGMDLEELIIFANSQYRAKGIAVIDKIPTEWKPLRNAQGRIVSAKVERKAIVDFQGRVRSRPIAFDAKHTTKRMRWDRVEPHQAEYLDDWTREPMAIGFVLVGFKMQRFFVIPWDQWGKIGTNKSVSHDQIPEEWEAKATTRAAIDYLAVVERLYNI